MLVLRSRHARLWRAFVLVVLCCALAALPGLAAAAPPGPQPAFVPGEVLVGWQAGTGPAAQGSGLRRAPLAHDSAEWRSAAATLAAQTGRTVLDVQPAFGFGRIAVPEGQETRELARLRGQPWVRYAEPNYLVYAAGIPNDPLFPAQWNMTGVAAPAAWDVTLGVNQVTVAVIDSGVDFNHPDLVGRLLSTGVNYITPGMPPQDDYGHGTHVAGIIAANTNNGIGVAGMAGNVRLLPFKVLDASGTGNIADLATAIYSAISSANNAQIINISLGAPNLPVDQISTLANAVSAAWASDVLVVAAAGNYGAAADGNPSYYPAALPGVLAVGASERYDGPAGYSGHQPYVALAAPGGTEVDPIISTGLSGAATPYAALYGTSMAAPMVSGAAALFWSINPTLTGDDLIFALEHGADKAGPYAYVGGRNEYYGFGRLNAWRAVRPLRLSSQSIELGTGCVPRLASQVVVQNVLDQQVDWTATTPMGQSWLSVGPAAGTLPAGGTVTLVASADISQTVAGSYDGTIRVALTSAPHSSLDIYTNLILDNRTYNCVYAPLVGR